MLEGNVLNVCNKVCTVEFQPGADMSWQSWAANELNQAATHPSPYGNVHKSTIAAVGGSIGHSASDTWQPYNMEIRQKHIEQVNKYFATIPASTSKENKHARKLQYMAENGIRQLGYPRIGYVLNLCIARVMPGNIILILFTCRLFKEIDLMLLLVSLKHQYVFKV